MSKLGGNVYGRASELFELPRPTKDGKFPQFRTKAQAAEEIAHGLREGHRAVDAPR